MEKIKTTKEVIILENVIVYKAFDGKEFKLEKDCLLYEQSKFHKQEFEKEFNISKIEDYYITDDILFILQYPLTDYTGEIYKITIPNNYYNDDFGRNIFERNFKIYFEINDKNFILTDIGELFFIKVYEHREGEHSYKFISKENLIEEFNKRIETIKNL